MTFQRPIVPVLLAAAALAAPSAAQAQFAFGPAQPLPGVPAGSTLTGAATGLSGTVTLAGTQPSGDAIRAFVSVNGGVAQSLGPSGALSTPPTVVAAFNGDAAIVWAVGHTAYLSTCDSGTCSAAKTIGRSSVFPQPAVAMNPATGRVTVLWRGRSRLQWRVTTAGRLGPAHSLGESGQAPALASDPSGKVVALWLRNGVRTAARRVGAFTRPTTLQSGPAAAPQVVTDATGTTLAAWLASPALDVQSPSAQAYAAVRTSGTRFGTPVAIGGATSGAVTLATSFSGHAVLALQSPAGLGGAIVQAATRPPGGAFGAAQTLSAPAFLSTAFPPSATVGPAGETTVAWAADATAAVPGSSGGAFALRSSGAGDFGGAVLQVLSAQPVPASLHAPVVASGGTTTIAWADAAGGHFAVAGR